MTQASRVASGNAAIDAYGDAFSRVYDVVMRDVGYPVWARHIFDLCQRYDLPYDDLLHLACGTGSLDSCLAPDGLRIVGVDQSPTMIEHARYKAELGGYDVDYRVGDMTDLALGRQFDLVLCLYDSVNYIVSEEGVQAAFACAYAHTRPGGGYIFDVTTEHNIIHNFANYTYAENFPEFSYIWDNAYDLKQKICTSTLTVFLRQPDGEGLFRKEVEEHLQRMYPQRTLTRWLKQAGFTVLAAHDGLTMDKVTSRSERIHFVCRRDG